MIECCAAVAPRLRDEHDDVRAAASTEPIEPTSCQTPATISTSRGRQIRDVAAPEVADLPRPVLGFAGNFLASKVDFDLLEAIARALPRLDVAPRSDRRRPETDAVLERLARIANVRWLGPEAVLELPRYVAAFDVGLIPYVENAYTRSCFPLKLYEYLAAGKPVVASGLPELAGMEPDVVLVDEAAAFVDAVQEAPRATRRRDRTAADAGRVRATAGKRGPRRLLELDAARARDS